MVMYSVVEKLRCSVSQCLLAVVFAFYGSLLFAQEDILVGMSGDMSGLSADIGVEMKRGLELGFAEINASGGVQGRNIRLLACDDGYVPLMAAKNVRQLIDEEHVTAILGSIGTPMAMLTVPIVNKRGVLMFGAFTGASVLRQGNVGCCVYNYRASYKQEIGMMLEHILNSGIKPNEIALLTQKDASGDTTYDVAIEKLDEYGLENAGPLLHTRYRKNTHNIEQSVADVLTATVPPKAIIMISTYGASSAFINLLKTELPQLKYYHISYAGSESLAELLGKDTDGVYITSVVPHVNADNALIRQYRGAHVKQGETTDFSATALEGYIVARIFIEVLQSIPGEINKTSILRAIERVGPLQTSIGPLPLLLKQTSRQASQAIWLHQFVDGQFKQIAVNYDSQ
ncbi:MAG: ABC transporter substrate-binding protein [Cycloclasticus sp.]